MSGRLRLALVSPRFEPVTAVGAEVQIAELAGLLSRRGHRVEILTTCIRDDRTGKNHYHPGVYRKRHLVPFGESSRTMPSARSSSLILSEVAKSFLALASSLSLILASTSASISW